MTDPQRQFSSGRQFAAKLARKPKKLAAVALANKTARIVWAVMVRGGSYRNPQPGTPIAAG